MSDRQTRFRLESVHGVRHVIKTIAGRNRGTWLAVVYTHDVTQRERDISARFRGLGHVVSCDLVTAKDPSERRFNVVLIAKDFREAAPVAASDGGPLSEVSE